MLTNREKDVIKLLLEGKSNREIAECLSISVHTVKAHLEHIYEKNGINSHEKGEHKRTNARINLIIKLAKTNRDLFDKIKLN